MAHNFQNVTLSLTLPISCQICLGKVRQPVICANNHVFCSACIEIWLKKAAQCPTCRVPITPENPCREILGGTNESGSTESHSVKKRLRKTRGELLLREYEDEIEGLLRDNEDLKTKNQSLESQLKISLDPCSISAAQREDRTIDPCVLEEWTNKLRAATHRYTIVKQDMEKLKEANKALRSQNIDLVQESMRLKAEVASRSPQKFGRYTVAALESKIQQYERDVDHLKRALERSDQYIEDLEVKVSESERRPSDQREAIHPHTEACPEITIPGDGEAGERGQVRNQRITTMRRSLSDMETASVFTNREGESETLSGNRSYLLTTSTGLPVSDKFPEQRGFGAMEAAVTRQKDGDMDMDSTPLEPPLPSTPSSAFRSLSLKSPGVRDGKRVPYKSHTYLRRLSFEDCIGSSSTSATENKRYSLSNLCNGTSSPSKVPKVGFTTKPVIWGDWQSPKSPDLTRPTPTPTGEQLNPTHGQRNTNVAANTVSHDLPDDVTDPDSGGFQLSSEASMDAAYLDKISELDSMMLEGESSSSRGSQLSLTSLLPGDPDATLVPEMEACGNLLSGADPGVLECGVGGGDSVKEGRHLSSLFDRESNGVVCGVTGPSEDSEPPATTSSRRGSESSSGDGHAPQGPDSTGSGPEEPSSQTDELSFDLLFDHLVENVATPSGGSHAHSPASEQHHFGRGGGGGEEEEEEEEEEEGPSSSGVSGKPTSTTKEKPIVNPSQPTKRKCHSSFNITSPSKVTKYV